MHACHTSSSTPYYMSYFFYPKIHIRYINFALFYLYIKREGTYVTFVYLNFCSTKEKFSYLSESIMSTWNTWECFLQLLLHKRLNKYIKKLLILFLQTLPQFQLLRWMTTTSNCFLNDWHKFFLKISHQIIR